MDIIAAQFTNWQTALEDFQKSVEKDLEEKERGKRSGRNPQTEKRNPANESRNHQPPGSRTIYPRQQPGHHIRSGNHNRERGQKRDLMERLLASHYPS